MKLLPLQHIVSAAADAAHMTLKCVLIPVSLGPTQKGAFYKPKGSHTRHVISLALCVCVCAWHLLQAKLAAGDGSPSLGDVFHFNELGLSPGHGIMLALLA